ELARVYVARGDTARADEVVARAMTMMRDIPDSRSQAGDVVLLRADLAIRRGDVAEAKAALAELQGLGLTVDPGSLRSRRGVLARLQPGDEAALMHLRAAEAAPWPGLPLEEDGLYTFTLARVLHALGREPERVATLTSEALAAYGRAGALFAGDAAAVR